MHKLVFGVAAAALALGVYQTLENQGLKTEIEGLRRDATDLRAEVATLKREEHAEPAAVPAKAPRMADLPAAVEAPAEGGGPRLVARAASPEVLAGAVRDLQQRVAAQEEKVEHVATRVEEEAASRPRVFRTPRFIASVDDAVGALDLTPTQQADMERLVEYANQDLQRLYQIPNADGKTLADVNKPVKVGGKDNAGIGILFTNLAAVTGFKHSTVPGRSETYAEAETRIRKDAKREIRDLLDPKQQKTWDDSNTDPLFKGAGGGATISFSTVTTTSDDEK